MTFSAGTRLGRYEILDRLGAGGMGEVYRAHDDQLGREVAIKVLPAEMAGDRERVARFETEARAVAALSHPNILSIHDFGVCEGTPYAVTELLRGETLRERLNRSPISWREASGIAARIAEAVAAAHAKGIIHRDLKPENIFLTRDGQVKVLDFGLAHVERPEAVSPTSVRTEVGQVMGSRGYMSPEQVRGEPIGAPSDIFSLGCVIFEMIHGHRPFDSFDAAVHAEAPSLSKAPPPLNRIVQQCLRKNAEERFQSARDLAFDLRAIGERSVSPRLSAAIWIAPLLLIAVAAVVFYVRGRSASTRVDSIAVLPFINVSRDPDTEYLSDGIAETLINDLSDINGLRVIPRASAFRFKGNPDFHEAARKLRVSGVVTGRVLRRGDSLNVQAELIDVDHDRQLWGGQYQKRMADLVTVQSDIARDVASHLQLRLSSDQQRRVGAPASANPSAYEAYLRGRYFWNKRTIDGLQKSIEYFRQATDADPTYALAYTGVADGYGLLGSHYYGGALPTEAMPRAKEAALKALSLDPNLAEAHSSLAWVLAQYDWNLPASEAEFRRAITLNPNYATAHSWLGITLACEEKYNDAIGEMSRAHELDPLSSQISFLVAWAFYYAREYGQAKQRLVTLRDLDATFNRTYFLLAVNDLEMRENEDAIVAAEECVRLSHGATIQQSYLARVFARAGRRSDAARALDEIVGHSNQHYIPPYYVAAIYAALGDRDKAFAFLQRSFDERSSAMTLLNIDPSLDSLRPDPRFATLLRRVREAAR